MDFYKYHGIGNDYIIIDPQKTFLKLVPENIKYICHRNYGIGSDGILYGPIFDNNTIQLKIYNADGSEAEKSGNGIRIFTKYLADENYIMDSKVTLSTKGGVVEAEIIDKEKGLIKVNMGPYTFDSSLIPVNGSKREVVDEIVTIGETEYTATCVSVGNPHCVIILNDISEHLARTVGPKIEIDTMFPNKINVQFVKVIDRKNIVIEIWERGSGYTLSSGSSSCAAVCASYKKGLVDSNVTVSMPGGTLDIEIDDIGNVHMMGVVASVAEGIFTYEMWENIT